MNSIKISKFTEALSIGSNDRRLVSLIIATTIFYSIQDISYLSKFCALIGWYLAILFRHQFKIKFYYWTILVVIYQVYLTYLLKL